MGAFVGIVFDGIAYGSLLFLISLGLSVTMGLMNFVNLAHGMFAMMGGFLSIELTRRAGMPFLLTLPVVFLVVGLGGSRSSIMPQTCSKTFLPRNPARSPRTMPNGL